MTSSRPTRPRRAPCSIPRPPLRTSPATSPLRPPRPRPIPRPAPRPAPPPPPRTAAAATAMNRLYPALSRGYARRRAAGPRLSAAEEDAIRANLDRARLIPALAGRYVIVDAASARLWMIDGGRV